MLQSWDMMRRYSKMEYMTLDSLVRHKKRKYLFAWKAIAKFRKSHALKPHLSKDIALATSMVNVIEQRLLKKKHFIHWYQEVTIARQISEGKVWHHHFSVRHHFKLWLSFVDRKRLEPHQRNHRRAVVEMLKQITTAETARTYSDDHGDDKPLSSQLSEQLSRQNKEEAISRRTTYDQSVGNSIAEYQESNRRRKCEEQRRADELAWNLKWNEKEERQIHEVIQKANIWLRSGEGKDGIKKHIKKIERELRNPGADDMPPTMIALSLLDSVLGHKGILSEVFFEDLRKSSKSGDITRSEFQKCLEKHDLLTFSKLLVRDIFDDDEKDVESKRVKDLKSDMDKTRTWCGVEGSQWKKYIDPVNQIIVFHNIVMGKKIEEYRLDRRLLRQLASDHFMYTAIINERKKVLYEMKIDRSQMVAIEGFYK